MREPTAANQISITSVIAQCRLIHLSLYVDSYIKLCRNRGNISDPDSKRAPNSPIIISRSEALNVTPFSGKSFPDVARQTCLKKYVAYLFHIISHVPLLGDKSN